jgi:hypothetical protein
MSISLLRTVSCGVPSLFSIPRRSIHLYNIKPVIIQSQNHSRLQTPALINFKFDSVANICKGSNQAMIYGFSHCKFYKLFNFFKFEESPIKKTFDSGITDNPHKQLTLDNRIIEPICKEKYPYTAALVNIVFENFKRDHLNLPFIPVLFCIDIDGNPFPLSPESLCSKDHRLNSFITHQELRRCYHLCQEFEDVEIRKIAQQTFKFVKITKCLSEIDAHELLEVNPPWSKPEWTAAWEKRMKGTLIKKHKKNRSDNWMVDLTKAVKAERYPRYLKRAFALTIISGTVFTASQLFNEKS